MLVCYNNKTPSYDLTYSKKVIIYTKNATTYLHISEIIYTFAPAKTTRGRIYCKRLNGEVAELVDALLWGGSVNRDVGVRVSSSSHKLNIK